MQAVTVYMTLAFAFTPVHAPSLPLQHVFFSHVAVAVALLHKAIIRNGYKIHLVIISVGDGVEGGYNPPPLVVQKSAKFKQFS